MSSRISKASWHPAFMPNSVQDLVTSSQGEKPSSESELQQPDGQILASEPENPIKPTLKPADEVVRLETPELEDNEKHPELESLRSALETSLASPGGLEMDENPTHSSSIPEEDRTNDLSGEANNVERGSFPSPGPSHPLGHASTISFARTVPQDIDWGETDEVDSEWNLHRTETDPFKVMAPLDRTNSFPQVPPAHHPGTSDFDELPRTQVEEIMQHVEQSTKSLFDDDDTAHDDDFFGQQSKTEDPIHDKFQAQDRGTSEISYDKVYGGDTFDEDESSARYDEGLPLVGEESSLEHVPSEAQTGSLTLFAEEEDYDESSFFAGMGGDSSTEPPTPHPLVRKSTSQVMDALHFHPIVEAHATIQDDQNNSDSQSAFDKATGGGIAVSKSTILSQVLAVSEMELSGLSQASAQNAQNAQQPSEEDLAAKWKAALDGDELLDDEELLDEESTLQNSAVDPSTFFGSDDEGFLEDDDEFDSSNHGTHTGLQPKSVLSPVIGSNGNAVGFDNLTGSARANRASSNSRYLPSEAIQAAAAVPSNPYLPSAPLLTDLTPQRTQSATDAHIMATQPTTVYGSLPQPTRPDLPKAQSFADKSKGGYSSPYDLPLDVLKPRKRASMQQMGRGYNNAAAPGTAPPPRSSSMFNQPPPSRGTTSSLSPPSTSHSFQATPNPPAPGAGKPLPPTLKSKGSFFEELPVVSRPKSSARYASKPEPPSFNPPVQQESHRLVQSLASSPDPQSTISSLQPTNHGLVAPPQLSPYASISSAPSPPPPTTSRYSPAPPLPQSQGGLPTPLAQGRYSAAPPQRAPMPPPAPFAHQPRTSSPLAHFERSQDQRPYSGHVTSAAVPALDRRGSSNYDHALRTPTLPVTQEVDENLNVQEPSNLKRNNEVVNQETQYRQQTPPPLAPSTFMHSSQQLGSNLSPSKRATSGYTPNVQSNSSPKEHEFLPPRRSQTQSPGRAANGPRAGMSAGELYQRPTSGYGSTSTNRIDQMHSTTSVTTSKPRGRGLSQGLSYITPTDGREHDPLQRWKGNPVFAWGVGGTIVTSFPKEIPRYGLNQAPPMIICSPGEVKLRSIKDICPMEERLASFPGPLKGKAKKKDVLSWLTAGIELLEKDNEHIKSLPSLTHDDKRKEERVLLWKILHVLIEHDGVLEGNPNVNNAIRSVLSPGLEFTDAGTVPQYTTGADLSGIFRAAGSTTQAEPVDPAAVDELRKHLLRGDREKAVWEAVDKRLWAHAMLISNTVSQDLYKQVAQEFVQKEVKSIGENTESLAALYEVFAGNFEESVDELVPPSARAGFQMVSTSGNTGPSKNAIDGLDRWRETLGLILSNRSPGDGKAVNALGNLLSGYGRAEAAHTCFIFARANSIFGGIDDPLSNIVLLGSDHKKQPYDFDRELEPVLLSEVYEYGLSLSATSHIPATAPHLAIYKLQHALVLAEFSQREKALQYCEAIASSITSQTRRSPYHHAALVSALDDLSKRLKQSPKDESTSWISKPSIDKVSGTVWAKFNKFVAGDETDAASAAAGGDSGAEVGPFARIAGGTPTISRSPSISDIYGSYNAAPALSGGIPIPAATRSTSRYAPGGSYTPPNPYDAGTSSSYGSQQPNSFGGASSFVDSMQHDQFHRPTTDSHVPVSHAPHNQGYAPRTHQEYTPLAAPDSHGSREQTHGGQYSSSQPSMPSRGPSLSPNVQGSFQGSSAAPSGGYDHPAASYDQMASPGYMLLPNGGLEIPASNGYEPPSNSGYEPPASSGYESPPNTEQAPFPNRGYEPPSSSGYQPPQNSGYEPSASSGNEPPSNSGYEPPPNSGYEPPNNGYAPPSYEPEDMNDKPDSPITTRPKKSFINDGEDIPRSQSVEKSKAEKDKEADEAFRKAAEADAQRDKAAPVKKGWGLGGWFGGKKEAALDAPASNKPIKAKLGEANSFFYDPELKRWVNKKGGKDDIPTPSATPPPPKGPARVVSGPPGMAPTSAPRPSMPPSISSAPPGRTITPASSTGVLTPGGSAAGISGLVVPPSLHRQISNTSMNGPGSAPPSRPSTSMSNASSIDDLLGPAMPRKAGGKKVKKGRGYIDLMGDKSGA